MASPSRMGPKCLRIQAWARDWAFLALTSMTNWGSDVLVAVAHNSAGDGQNGLDLEYGGLCRSSRKMVDR